MNRACLFLLALLATGQPFEATAQGHVTALKGLTVQLWPDYDRPSVLVMLTGDLGAEAPSPAVVDLPLPPDAQLNAVARIDAGGKMIADLIYSSEAGKLTLATPDPAFRVEYYVPYQVEGDMRSFAFTWVADLSVGELSAIVQKPAGAGSLVTQPAASRVTRGQDGLEYHVLPSRAVARGDPYSFQISYPAVPLSIEALGIQKPAAPPPPVPAPMAPQPAEPAPEAGAASGWALVAAAIGAAVLTMLLTWQAAKSRFASAPSGSPPPDAGAGERACPECGSPSAEGDRFCSRCGSALSA